MAGPSLESQSLNGLQVLRASCLYCDYEPSWISCWAGVWRDRNALQRLGYGLAGAEIAALHSMCCSTTLARFSVSQRLAQVPPATTSYFLAYCVGRSPSPVLLYRSPACPSHILLLSAQVPPLRTRDDFPSQRALKDQTQTPQTTFVAPFFCWGCFSWSLVLH